MRKIDWLIILLTVIFSTFVLKELFKPYFYTSHDGIHQVVRLYFFDQALRDGQIPPRWAGGLLNGFGYPLFIFSYHLPWLLAEPLHLFGLSIFESIKMTFLVGFILSGITMYFFQREVFGRTAAIVGTTLYLFAPYRFSNIFVRAAIGDATAFIFPPLLFLSLFKLKKSGKIIWQWIALGAMSLSGILLSHAMVFFFFFLSFLLYLLFFSISLPKRWQFIRSGILIALLAFGISAYYFIPSLVERNLTKFTEIMRSVYFGATFLNLSKLIYSPWGYGTIDAREGTMSLQLGIAQWLVVGLSFLTISFICLQKTNVNKFISLKKFFFRPKTELPKEPIFYFLIFIFSIILMLPISSPFWNLTTKIVFIDFTWRVLAVSIFAVSVLAGFVVSQSRFPLVIGLLLVILAVYGNRNHLRINQVLDWPLSFYLQLEKTTNSYDEYTPKWVRRDLIEEKRPKVEFSDNRGKIKISKATSNYLEFTIDTPEKGEARINTIYYPGWNVSANNKPVNINYKDSGFIEVPVDRGTSRIIARFQETPLRLGSNLISLFSISFVGFVLLTKRKK